MQRSLTVKNWKKLINDSHFRFINHTKRHTFFQKPYTALTSFAIDDTLALSVGARQSLPTLRLWSHPKTVVLGIPDARLPYINEGVSYLSKEGFQVIIRNSGGLAVALDEGVLNISLILPDIKHISIHNGYEAMYSFIQMLFHDITNDIKAYEIVGSYCPGDYDLSIHGIKFAGISQRRVRNGVSIQIYLDIEGDSLQRAQHIQTFYQLSKRDIPTKFTYPTVDPHKMGSLSKLLERKMTVEEVQNRIMSTFERLGISFVRPLFSTEEQAQFHQRYDQIVKRNQKVIAINNPLSL